MKQKSTLILLAILLTHFTLIAPNGKAQEQQPIAQSIADLYEGETATSKSDLDYRPLDHILKGIVFVVGRSNRQAAPELSLPTGTRISPANPERTRFEGNRIFYHLIGDTEFEIIQNFRRDLEAIPNWIKMSSLSKDAQLAYWLNLYNITLIEKIAERYPITDIERLRSQGLWDEKLLTIRGLPLSLNDIQYRILSNWDDPKIIYGLFQGAIGGPNMRDHAFRASNVHSALANNARDFVNSLRGVQFWNNKAKISDYYRHVSARFPDNINSIRVHMMQYAEGSVAHALKSATTVEYGDYDKHIADLYNGILGGSSINDNSAASMTMNQTSGITGPQAYTVNVGGSDTFGTDMVGRTSNLPPHAVNFLHEIIIRNRARTTNISIEDVKSENETIITSDGEEEGSK